MKKTLIAVAALAATGAFAQNVTVSGTMDATYRSGKTETAAGVATNTNKIGKDGIGTTGFTLSGNEDLGGGMKAVFLVETNFDGTDTANQNSVLNGQMFVGLEGGFGSIKLGAPNSPSLTVQSSRGGSFSTKDGGRLAPGAGGYTTLMGVAVTRFDNSVNYTTPNFGGFSAGVTYAPKSDDGATPAIGALTDIGGFYSNGPIAAGVSIYNQEFSGAGNKQALTSYYVTYDFKFAKFGLGGHAYKADNATVNVTDNSSIGALAEVPLSTALTLSVNLQKLDDKGAADVDSTMMAVGVQYALSKRTTVYARYVSQTANTDLSAGTTVKTASTMLAGLRHNF